MSKNVEINTKLFGHPTSYIKRVLKRLTPLSSYDFYRQLKITHDETEKLFCEMHEAGLLEIYQSYFSKRLGRIVHDYLPTKSNAVREITRTKCFNRFTRTEGYVLVEQILALALEINESPESHCYIKEIKLFGSLIKPYAGELIGDVDIGIYVIFKPGHKFDYYNDIIRRNKCYSAFRKISRRISVHSTLDAEQFTHQTILVYDIKKHKALDVSYELVYGPKEGMSVI